MAKKPRKEHDTALEFGTPEWMEDREKQLDQEMATHDYAKDILFRMMWDGWIKFRIFPVFTPEDWLRCYGEHFGVFPGPDGKPTGIEGCPEATHNKFCPVCYGVDKAIAEQKADRNYFYGMGGIGAQKKYMLFILLLEANLRKSGTSKKNVPVFEDLPQVKILSCPKSVAEKIRGYVQNDDYGYKTLTHPTDGVVFKLTKDSSKDGKDKYSLDPVIKDDFAIPEEYFNYEVVQNEDGEDVKRLVGFAEGFPEQENFLPKTTGDELMAKIQKHEHEIDPFVANFNLSLDVSPERKALPAGSDERDERPSKSETMASLKARMQKRKEGK